MSGGHMQVRFRVLGTAYAVYETVDPGWMRLKTLRHGTADEIEASLWEEILRDGSSFRKYIRSLAEKCEAGRRLADTDFEGNITKMDNARFTPDYVSPPGDTIMDILEEIESTTEILAEVLGLSPKETTSLIIGDSPITQDIADELAKFLGSTPDFWMKREENYRENLKKSRENG